MTSWVLAALMAASLQEPVRIEASVVDVVPGRVRLEIASDLLPTVGDRVTLGTDLDGTFIALDALWRISRADDQVWAERVGEGPDAGRGYKAIIESATPRRGAGASAGSVGGAGGVLPGLTPIARGWNLNRAPSEELLGGVTIGQFLRMQEALKAHVTDDVLLLNVGRGWPEAHYWIAGIYYQGTNGVPKDPATALLWFRLAAGAGHPAASYMVGNYYQGGLGVAVDYAQALTWYERAMAAGFADAFANAGRLYFEGGHGVAQDRERAQQFWIEAARRGHQPSQTYLQSIGVAWQTGSAK